MHLMGLLLVIVGGVMEGLFALPVKLTARWSWENIWGAGSFAALLFGPVPLLVLTFPHFMAIYAATPPRAVMLAAFFGTAWGLGGIFYGLGIAQLGISLGTSAIMGLIAIGGSIVPFAIERKDQIFGAKGLALLAGIGAMIAGLIVCARAGDLRLGTQGSKVAKRPASRGIFYCLAAGVLSAMVNFALIFGAPIADVARSQGASAFGAGNAIWAIVFAVNYSLNVAYCLYLMRVRKSFNKFRSALTGTYWILAAAMGILWAGGIVVYGFGASMGGTYGPVFAFPVMLIVSILAANLTGVMLGEWRGTTKSARQTMQVGVALMVASIAILGCAN